MTAVVPVDDDHASVGLAGDRRRPDLRVHGCRQFSGLELRVLLADPLAPGRGWLVSSDDGGLSFHGTPLDLPENACPAALG